jgi:hypothetical protein
MPPELVDGYFWLYGDGYVGSQGGSGAGQYKEDITKALRRIATMRIGRCLLSAIKARGWVAFHPSESTGHPDTRLDPDTLAAGDGPTPPRGSLIRFSPSDHVRYKLVAGKQYPNWKRAGDYLVNEPDEVLFHEMFHALRTNLDLERRWDGLDREMARFDNEAEFFAILATNIYLSEKYNTTKRLLDTHHSDRPVAEMAIPDAFVVSQVYLFREDNFSLIAKLCRQQEKLTKELADADGQFPEIKFNPLRAYYDFVEMNLHVPMTPELVGPTRTVAFEQVPLMSDDRLIEILQPRYHADDVAAYGGRVARLRNAFRSLPGTQALALFARLLRQDTGDRVARLFHDHLSTATRSTMLKLLVQQRLR